MWTRSWELKAAAVAALWCVLLSWLGMVHSARVLKETRQELAARRPKIGWQEDGVVVDLSQGKIAGLARIAVQPAGRVPIRVRYTAGSSSHEAHRVRTVPPGCESLSLYFDLGLRPSRFTPETVTLRLDSAEGAEILDAEQQVPFAAERYEAELVASRRQLREDVDDEVRVAVRLNGPAHQEMTLGYELSGDGIEQGFYAAPQRPPHFEVLQNRSESEEIVIRRQRPLEERDRTIRIALLPNPGVDIVEGEIPITCLAFHPPEIDIEAEPPEVTEGDTITVTASLAGGRVERPVKIAVEAVGGTAELEDYTLDGLRGEARTWELMPGQTSAQFTITTVDDKTALEGVESLELRFRAYDAKLKTGDKTTGYKTIVLEIRDNEDPLEMTIRRLGSERLLEAGDSETHAVVAEFSNADRAEEAVTVTFEVKGSATPGKDYTLEGLDPKTGKGTLVISAGERSATAAISATNDDEPLEEEEIVSITFSSPGQTRLNLQELEFRIEDDDVVKLEPIDALAALQERPGDSPQEVAVAELHRTLGEAVVVEYLISPASTAEPGVDFSIEGLDVKRGKGTLSVPPNVKQVVLPFTVRKDGQIEGDETIVLRFSNPALDRDIRLTVKDADTDGDAVLLLLATDHLKALLKQSSTLSKELGEIVQGADRSRFVGESVVLVHPKTAEQPQAWTAWSAAGAVPLQDAEFFGINTPLGDQLERTFEAMQDIRAKAEGRPLLALILWISVRPPENELELPENALPSDEQELYFLWLGGKVGVKVSFSESLKQAFARYGEVVHYLDLDESASLASYVLRLPKLRRPSQNSEDPGNER